MSSEAWKRFSRQCCFSMLGVRCLSISLVALSEQHCCYPVGEHHHTGFNQDLLMSGCCRSLINHILFDTAWGLDRLDKRDVNSTLRAWRSTVTFTHFRLQAMFPVTFCSVLSLVERTNLIVVHQLETLCDG